MWFSMRFAMWFATSDASSNRLWDEASVAASIAALHANIGQTLVLHRDRSAQPMGTIAQYRDGGRADCVSKVRTDRRMADGTDGSAASAPHTQHALRAGFPSVAAGARTDTTWQVGENRWDQELGARGRNGDRSGAILPHDLVLGRRCRFSVEPLLRTDWRGVC